MLKFRLRDYSDTHILVKETIARAGSGTDDAEKRTNKRNKGVIFENCALFTDCISEINNMQVDNVKDLMFLSRCIITQKHLEVYGNITETNQMIL